MTLVSSLISSRSKSKTKEEIKKAFESITTTRRIDEDRVRQMFISVFTHTLIEQIHEGFMAKSVPGGTDDLGLSWKPLAESTIKRKLKKRNDIQRELKRELAKYDMTPQQREEKAFVLASQMVPIGIDTGELEAACRPGRLTKFTYIPPENQDVEIDQRGLRIVIDVDHAPHFHRKRRIWPSVNRMQPWIRAAMAEASRRVFEHLQRKLNK